MQRLTVDVFLSVDGWARGETSPGYFGYLGPELEEWITAELALPQLVVLGRRTYEVLAGLPEQARDASWHRMTELDKVVFSGTLERTSWPNTRICRDDLITEVTGLKGDGDVPVRTMGSLSVARGCGPGRPTAADDVPTAGGGIGPRTGLRGPGIGRPGVGQPSGPGWSCAAG
jgi:dihydrofolate reductase